MQEYQTQTGESHEMSNEQVTQFIEERLQLLEKKGKVNHGEYKYIETEKEACPSLLNLLKKMFRGIFSPKKKRSF